MLQTIIKWAWLAVILLFVFWGVIFGLGRGLRKTVSRGIWLIITAVVLFFVTGLIINGVLTMDLSTFGVSLKVDGTTYTNLKDYLTQLICSNAGIENSTANAETIASLFELVKLFLNAILFTILFVLCRYLLFPLNAIIYHAFFKGKAVKQYKRDMKQYKRDLKTYNKEVKHMKKLKVEGFADGDFEHYEETLKPINEGKKRKLASLEELMQNETSQNVSVNTIESKQPTKTKVSQPIQATDAKITKKIENEEKTDAKPSKEVKTEKTENIKPNKKDENKVVVQNDVLTKPVKPKKPSKKRGWGALAGAVVGLFLCSMTLVPFSGIFKMINDINQEPATIIDKDNTEDGLITALIKQTLKDQKEVNLLGEKVNIADTINYVLDYYNTGIGAQVFTYTGTRALSNLTFNELSSAKIGDTKIYLEEDVVNMVKVASEAMTFMDAFDKIQNEGYTVTNIGNALDLAKTILNDALSLKIIQGTGSAAVPVVKEFALKYINKLDINEKEVIVAAVNALFNTLTSESNIIESIKSDLLSVIDVAIELNREIVPNNASPINANTVDNRKSVLSILLNGNFEEDRDLLLDYLTSGTTLNTILHNTLSTKIIASTLPYGVYYLTSYLCQTLDVSMGNDVTYSNFENMTQISTALENVATNAVKLYNTIDLENLDFTKIDTVAFTYVGKILDNIQNNLLPKKTLDNFVEFGKNTIVKSLPEIDLGFANLTDYIKDLIMNTEYTTSWEDDLTKIGQSYNKLISATTNPILDLDNITDINSLDFSALGEQLDLLCETGLLKDLNSTIQNAIETLIDKIINPDDKTINAEKEEVDPLKEVLTYVK